MDSNHVSTTQFKSTIKPVFKQKSSWILFFWDTIMTSKKIMMIIQNTNLVPSSRPTMNGWGVLWIPGREKFLINRLLLRGIYPICSNHGNSPTYVRKWTDKNRHPRLERDKMAEYRKIKHKLQNALLLRKQWYQSPK